jgi:hypothetical protein
MKNMTGLDENEKLLHTNKNENLEKLTKALLLIVRDAEAENKNNAQLKQQIKNKVIEDQSNEN